MKLPSSEVVHGCYQVFYKATSSSALTIDICAVCTRESDLSDTGIKMKWLPLTSIPNSHCLIPSEPHPAHDLYDGKLLEPASIVSNDNHHTIVVCRECLDDLRKPKNRPPVFLLVNNMWIGRVPWQIHALTFSEQLLVALLYPQVYVFKLFLKKMFGKRDMSDLQHGMRGTVSTYELDMKGIQSMLEGKLMPRKPSVLASVISVTYVGLGELPKRWLRSTFRVQRAWVGDTLLWLKGNNQKYYGDITLDQDLLGPNGLLEDDVPDEVLSLIR